MIAEYSPEEELALELIANTNASFLLTGPAGTGKTAFIRDVQERVKGKQFIVLAPTGLAALNAGGQTVHSFFGLPLTVCTGEEKPSMGQAKREALLHADTLIIDEVSMLRCDVLDAVDRLMREVMSSRLPFGGKQMVFVGDLFQLPPVAVQGVETEYLHDVYGGNSFFFFKAKAFDFLPLPSVEFTKVFRQENEEFVAILKNVRLGCPTPGDLKKLNERVAHTPADGGTLVTLAPYNALVDGINAGKLAQIRGEEYTFKGEIKDKFPQQLCIAPQELRLKVGARVMFLRNDTKRRWVNGTLGTVSKLSEDSVSVSIEGGKEEYVPQAVWESYTYKYDREKRELVKEVEGTYRQYPLKLAWAITIHKSQGMTFDNVFIHYGGGVGMPGQLYVALSRARSIKGVCLNESIGDGSAIASREAREYRSNINGKEETQAWLAHNMSLYPLLRQGDYDEASRLLLLSAHREACEGKIDEALRQAWLCLSLLVCDDSLYGAVTDIPSLEEVNDTSKKAFLASLFSLYACRYEQALTLAPLAEEAQQWRTDALYIKARALTKLGRLAEANSIHLDLYADKETHKREAKVLFAIARLNDTLVGNYAFPLMYRVMRMRPRCPKPLLELRAIAKRRNITVAVSPSKSQELPLAFHSPMPDETFLSLLAAKRREPRREEYRDFMSALRRVSDSLSKDELTGAKPKDVLEALKWHKAMAEQGHEEAGAEAQFLLAQSHMQGLQTPSDEAEALRLLTEASEKGHIPALYNLGVCYAQGRGTEQDLGEAVRCFRAAALMGHPMAQANLGLCYLHGIGVESDAQKAVHWLTEASLRDDAVAICNLAVCLALGWGVSRDSFKAIGLLHHASRIGCPYASPILSLLNRGGRHQAHAKPYQQSPQTS